MLIYAESKLPFTTKTKPMFPRTGSEWNAGKRRDNKMQGSDGLGWRLSQLIKEKGMTKAELARQSGATRQNIGQIISGANKGGVSAPVLFGLADALGVHARWLYFGTGPRERRDRFDVNQLVSIISSVSNAVESHGRVWDYPQMTRAALSLYKIWEKTGKLPDVDQSVRLLLDQADGA